ncbi:MAG: vWA domain-containing protein [Bacteroidota bacterium]
MRKTLSFIAVLIPIACGVFLINKLFWGQVMASNQDELSSSFTIGMDKPEPLEMTAEYGATVQIALLLDISGSMNGLIDQAKGRLWDIVNEMSSARINDKATQLEIALYIYGSPTLGIERGYTRQVTPFTTDLDLISEELFNLGTSGGDEFCGYVIQEATQQLRWTNAPNDLRMIFIAGNEEFTQGSVNYVASVGQAVEQGIVVNTIFCGDIVRGRQIGWENGAKIGLGEYMNINHNDAVTHISTPYDLQIQTLNQSLNHTYVCYGEEGKLKQERQMAQDANASTFGSANVVKRAKSKASSSYSNESWDLLDGFSTGTISYEDLDRSTLPDSVSALNEKEFKEFVDEKAEDRERLKKEINDLYKKRQAFVEAERKKVNKEAQLDDAMLDAIRKQGSAKGMTFKKK